MLELNEQEVVVLAAPVCRTYAEGQLTVKPTDGFTLVVTVTLPRVPVAPKPFVASPTGRLCRVRADDPEPGAVNDTGLTALIEKPFTRSVRIMSLEIAPLKALMSIRYVFIAAEVAGDWKLRLTVTVPPAVNA